MINEFRPMNHLTGLQNLICTIGNLPTSYALSLSYEEQIWWLCDFLENKVFPAIEENTNITEETQAKPRTMPAAISAYHRHSHIQSLHRCQTSCIWKCIKGNIYIIILLQIYQ